MSHGNPSTNCGGGWGGGGRLLQPEAGKKAKIGRLLPLGKEYPDLGLEAGHVLD